MLWNRSHSIKISISNNVTAVKVFKYLRLKYLLVGAYYHDTSEEDLGG